jgi:hypothetical protein
MRSALSLGSNYSRNDHQTKGFATVTIGSGGGTNSKGTSMTASDLEVDLSAISGYGQTMARTDPSKVFDIHLGQRRAISKF